MKKQAPALAAVPAMPDGKKNQGFNYAMLYDLPGAATQVMRGHVDAKGTIAVHQGAASPCILYVVSGTGEAFAERRKRRRKSAPGSPTSRTTGSCFSPNTLARLDQRRCTASNFLGDRTAGAGEIAGSIEKQREEKMPETILHHYQLSPYSEKIRLALGLKNKDWRSVEIPVWTPRPKLCCR